MSSVALLIIQPKVFQKASRSPVVDTYRLL
jgi:hypothetical protein